MRSSQLRNLLTKFRRFPTAQLQYSFANVGLVADGLWNTKVGNPVYE